MLVIECALVGQTETPRVAIGQPYAEARLQRLDAAADRGRRRAKRHRAGRDAARFHDSAKKFDVAEAVRQGRLPCFRRQEA